MPDIKYNLHRLNEAKKNISNLAYEIECDKNKLNALFDTLKEDWQTKAGDTFFERYGEDWLNGINDFVERLVTLSKMLEKATMEYELIKDEVNKVKC